eukprot:CAMPEP_0181228128 /NCGR_PEP_ID=MMETSP1096-20121128/33182_1 /TAXON_ID=156174 ORGANISM="Chrysochromulina ericina, Strain CCMP281" /NCGR_SAMPLE_ID=MMETSP1096 /ASSEMBLY_ACC=CAM_ASM_000453 /LENGTH=178 /DNA_ID=CAMNT_0023321631 /DNA_START=399 /DNA_END=931 /DNA_ORIENTATION=-
MAVAPNTEWFPVVSSSIVAYAGHSGGIGAYGGSGNRGGEGGQKGCLGGDTVGGELGEMTTSAPGGGLGAAGGGLGAGGNGEGGGGGGGSGGGGGCVGGVGGGVPKRGQPRAPLRRVPPLQHSSSSNDHSEYEPGLSSEGVGSSFFSHHEPAPGSKLQNSSACPICVTRSPQTRHPHTR